MGRALVCLAVLLLATAGNGATANGMSGGGGLVFPLGEFSEFTEVGIFANGMARPLGELPLVPAVRLDAYYWPSDYEVFSQYNPAAFLLQLQSTLGLPLNPLYLLGSVGGALAYSATVANNWRGGPVAGAGIGSELGFIGPTIAIESRYLYIWLDNASDWKFIPVGVNFKF